MIDDEKKAKAIIKMIELAEEIGWQSLAIARDTSELDPEGLLIGTTEFIEGFKQEMEKSLDDAITEQFLSIESDDSSDDDDGSGGKTFH